MPCGCQGYKQFYLYEAVNVRIQRSISTLTRCYQKKFAWYFKCQLWSSRPKRLLVELKNYVPLNEIFLNSTSAFTGCELRAKDKRVIILNQAYSNRRIR